MGQGGDAQGDKLSGISNLTGSGFNDTLIGDGFDNVLNGGTGNDNMSGGAGNDTYIVDSLTESITEATSAGTDIVQSSVNFTLSVNLENLTLTGTTATSGTGNTADNVLIANNAGNTLYGLSGNDTLTGGTGNDTLIGGLGEDSLSGGGGSDTASYVSSTSDVTVSLATGLGQGGDAQGDKLSGISNLTGSGFNDTLTGDGNSNTLIGGDGADSLFGGAGDDRLDLITNTTATASAIDSADGGSGNDAVIVSQTSLGGALNGGADYDTLIVYGSANSTLIISSLNAQNFEKLDVKTDNSATNIILSSSAISNLVNSSGADTLTLRLGSEDSYSIATESNVTFTQGQSVKFFNTGNTLIAQVNFEYV